VIFADTTKPHYSKFSFRFVKLERLAYDMNIVSLYSKEVDSFICMFICLYIYLNNVVFLLPVDHVFTIIIDSVNVMLPHGKKTLKSPHSFPFPSPVIYFFRVSFGCYPFSFGFCGNYWPFAVSRMFYWLVIDDEQLSDVAAVKM
jgi:hypothetical protein